MEVSMTQVVLMGTDLGGVVGAGGGAGDGVMPLVPGGPGPGPGDGAAKGVVARWDGVGAGYWEVGP